MKGGKTPIHRQAWYPTDYHADEHVRLLKARRDYRTLTFYRHFLDASFLAGGDLPADPEALAAVVEMPRKDVEQALSFCLGRLITQDGARLYQKRIRRDVTAELEFRSSQAELGRRGGLLAGKGRPLIKDRAGPLESIGPPFAVRRSPAPTPERTDGTERPPESPQPVGNAPGVPERNGPEGDEPERQELLAVCRAIALKGRLSVTTALERVSAIPAGNGHAGKSFSDPRAKGVSIEWVRAALSRAKELQLELDRPLPA
jgi:hypothetical protein